MYDLDGDGELSLREVKKAFRHMIKDETIEDLFKQYDENDNKLISFQEFINLMTPLNTLVSDEVYNRINANYF